VHPGSHPVCVASCSCCWFCSHGADRSLLPAAPAAGVAALAALSCTGRQLLLGAAIGPVLLSWPAQGAVTGSRCDADMLGWRYLRYLLRLLRRPALLTALAGDACSTAQRRHMQTDEALLWCACL
jgi:hypothetical protein